MIYIVLICLIAVVVGYILAIQLTLIWQFVSIIALLCFKIKSQLQPGIEAYIAYFIGWGLIICFLLGILLGDITFYIKWYDGHGINIPNPFVPY